MTETEEAKETPIIAITPEDLELVRRLFSIVQGKNPDMQQTITDIMKMDSPIAKTNLPTRKDVQRIVYLAYASKSLFPDTENDPFSIALEAITTAFASKSGWIINKIVEMLRNTTDLSEIENLANDPQKMSILDRVRQRGSTE